MEEQRDLATIAGFYRRVQWSALALGVLWVIWLLAPILSPFVFAALLGWLGDPMVDRLEARGIKRNNAVILVFGVMTLMLVIALILLVPLLEQQIMTLVDSLPHYRDWFVGTALPWVERRTGLQILSWLDPERLFVLIREHWQSAGGVAAAVLGYVSRSGFALLGWLANIVLLPVLTFFFLRDWDVFVERVTTLVPPRWRDTTTQLATESGDILRAFLRGQFLVMLALGAIYAIGLQLVGLKLGILIGVIAGLISFIPYLGATTGVILAVVAALVQAQGFDIKLLALVGTVFVVGQLLESYVLTPRIVGDKIGLHPMAVIFAIMAGGQLFGFVGMLLALPVAAVANVMLRFASERYRQSDLYTGEHPAIVLDPYVDAGSVAQAERGPESP